MQGLPFPAVHGPARVALIGAGGYGRVHLRCLAALHREGLGELVAVADPFVEKQAELHAQLTGSGVRWHRDYRQLISQEKDLDLVIISTPIPLHEEMTRHVLKHSEAVIYLEKPPVPTLRQLEQLAALDTARRVHIGFHMMTWQPFRELKELMRAGRFGRIRRITAGAAWPPHGRLLRPRGLGWTARRDRGHAGVRRSGDQRARASGPQRHVRRSPGRGRYERPVEIRGEFYRARDIESYDAACLSGRFGTGIEYAIAVAHCTNEEFDYTLRVEGELDEARLSFGGRRLVTSFSDGFALNAANEPEPLRQAILRAREGLPPITSPADCLGYSEATCGGLLSSGDIHTIPASFVTADGASDPLKAVRHVEGICAAIRRTVETGLVWSEQDIPWAVASRPVEASSLKRWSSI